MIKVIFVAIVLVATFHSSYGYLEKLEDEEKCLCPRNYEPVCDLDGEVYSNECTFKCVQAAMRRKNVHIEMRPPGTCDLDLQW